MGVRLTWVSYGLPSQPGLHSEKEGKGRKKREEWEGRVRGERGRRREGEREGRGREGREGEKVQ